MKNRVLWTVDERYLTFIGFTRNCLLDYYLTRISVTLDIVTFTPSWVLGVVVPTWNLWNTHHLFLQRLLRYEILS